jgi:hypothetical protein
MRSGIMLLRRREMQNHWGKLGVFVAVGLASVIVAAGSLLAGRQQDDGAYLDGVRGTWGCGPCTGIGMGNCGGYSAGAQTCAYGEGGCNGDCASKCPEGSSNEYCMGLLGSCTVTWVTCSTMSTYKCVTAPYPARCQCTVSGTAGVCSRSDC